MMGWNTDTTEFARALARQFAMAFPPALALGTTSADAADRQRAKALQRLLLDAAAYQTREKIGVIRKVLFARSFQQEMRTLGFPGSEIRSITSELLSRLAFS
jgi:hypothetical protein